MLNMIEFGFELISDADMYLFFDKVMMGDISFISKRYSKANNKYLKYYDPKQESKHFKYLSYRHAMSKFLPTCGIIWKDPKDFDSTKYSSSSYKGCVSEVDLKYPKELCELHMIILWLQIK